MYPFAPLVSDASWRTLVYINSLINENDAFLFSFMSELSV